MRGLIRFAAAALAVGLAVAPVTAADASPLDRRQWWVDTWGLEEKVWPKTKGQGVTVAVLDTGVNGQLPDMRAAVLPGKSFGSGGDGRRDTEGGTQFGHGTGMASLIAARGTGTGFTGVAPAARILPLATPGIGDVSAAPAIRYAVDHGAKVISISRGSSSEAYPGQCPKPILDAVAYAAKKDVIVVAAAGNDGDLGNAPNYPASCPGVVGVGAMDNRGRIWTKSQRHPYVTLSAPGVNIPALSQDGRVWPNGAGTSHATALAAGGFALLRSAKPNLTARQIVQLATNTAKDFGPKGKDDQFGYGVLNPNAALTRQIPANAPNPVYERLDKALGGNGENGKPAAAEESGGSTGLFIGIAVAVVILVVLGVFFLARSRRRPRGGPPAGMPPQPGFGTGNQPLPGNQPGYGPADQPGFVPPPGSRPDFAPPAGQPGYGQGNTGPFQTVAQPPGTGAPPPSSPQQGPGAPGGPQDQQGPPPGGPHPPQ